MRLHPHGARRLNVALSPENSVERHFMDTIEGGDWLNDQDLAWLLVETAPKRVRGLETELAVSSIAIATAPCHQKAFAGQTFDRTVHKGDLTGIEVVNRLAEQVWHRDVRRLEDHRALGFVPTADRSELAGVLMLDMRTGEPLLVRAGRRCWRPAAGRLMYRYQHRRPATSPAMAWPWRCAPACRCATSRWCSSIRPGCSLAKARA